MAFMYTEGTSDYIAATPALIIAFRASGSITAGRMVQFDAGNTVDVYVPAGAATGSSIPIAGLALATVADGDPCPVLVWGYVKNLTKAGASDTYYPGQALFLSGAGKVYGVTWAASPLPLNTIGKVVSGSGTYASAFVNLMK